MLKLYFIRKYSQFKSTVNLPSTAFPLNVKQKAKHEAELREICKFDDLYKWQSNANKDNETFILHDGPPYANGDVHVGHALNKILKDITNRYKLLRGYKVHYVPGWDCHGLPIEMKAIKSKQQMENLSPLEIRQKAKAFAETTIEHQKIAFQKWGILADWRSNDGCYYTLNKSYQIRELNYFYETYKKNLIYRDFKPVYWSASSKTALAESELEYNDKHISKSIYVLFPILSSSLSEENSMKMCVLVWTTQPWTLPANQALCYNSDTSYSFVKLKEDTLCLVATDAIPRLSTELNCSLEVFDSVSASQIDEIICGHPMDSSRTVKMYPAAHATTSKGSGIVHTAPAHGVEDFQVALQHSLPTDSHVDEKGCFTAHSGYGLEGKFIFDEGNDAVIEAVDACNNLVQSFNYVHSYPYDWRTKKPIFVQTSRQWFIDTNYLQEKALSVLSEVQILPNTGHTIMKSVLKARPYWCISRQRVWGLPIPVFFHKKTGDVLINDSSMKHIISLVEDQGPDIWFTSSIDQLLPQSALDQAGYNGSNQDFERGKDILDIWFDSGISWAAVLRNANNDAPTVADLYLEGKDQYNGWFQSSLLTSVGLQGRAPYKSVLVHGFCVAEDGQKMSKSLGNVIDPMIVVEGGKNLKKDPSHGADALRWWVAKSNISLHVQISKTIMDDAAASVQKIRSCLRFLISNLNDFDPDTWSYDQPMQPIDQYFASCLKEFIEQVTDSYNQYKYALLCRIILNYATKLSTLYFSVVKDRYLLCVWKIEDDGRLKAVHLAWLYCEEQDGALRRSSQALIHITLEALIKSIAPILPHLAEETALHQTSAKSSSAFKDGWFDCNHLVPLYEPAVVDAVEMVLPFREALFSLISTQSPSQPGSYDVTIHIPSVLPNLQILQSDSSSNQSSLCEILSCAKCTLSNSPITNDGVLSKNLRIRNDGDDIECMLTASLSNAFKCPRCRRHTADENGGQTVLASMMADGVLNRGEQSQLNSHLSCLRMCHGFNSHPSYVVASLDKMLHDDYLCLVDSDKQQIKEARKGTGKPGKTGNS